jgi:anti-sigma factor RsiW
VSHLGDRAAAFVDGQLNPESAERATAHLASCRPCRDLVELERLTKVRLATLAGPAPSADLVGRLLAMGGPAGPLPPRPGHVPGTPRPAPVPVRASAPAGVARRSRSGAPTRPAGRPVVLGGRRSRLAVAVAGALSVVGVGVAGVGVAGVGAAGGSRTVVPGTGAGGGSVAQLTSVLPGPAGSGGTSDWLRTSSTRLSPVRSGAQR